MDTITKTINEALGLLTFELRPHINKICMTKSLLLEGCDEITDAVLAENYNEFERFISGLYNVMEEATDAYTRVYEKIEQLAESELAAAH